MKIAFGCDPNAVDLKLVLTMKAQQLRHEVKNFDVGDPVYINTTVAVAKAVVAGEFDRGVLVCSTGAGVPIATNKAKGAYYVCVTDICQVQRATLSSNANLVAIGLQVVGVKPAEMFPKEYLKYTFDPTPRNGAKVTRIYGLERED